MGIVCLFRHFKLLVYFGEATATDELSEQGVAWYPFVVHIGEVLQKFDKAVGGDEVGAITLHFAECGQSVLFHYAEFVGQRGVEHKVATLLIGVDPLELATTNTWPHLKRALCRRIAILAVANDTTEQADIGKTDGVVHVDVDLELWRDVDFELLVLGDCVRKLVV